MKKYFKMKYEQWLMRLFDWVCKKLIKTGNEWVIEYPCEEKIYKLEDKLMDLEDKLMDEVRRNDQLEYHLLDKFDQIHELENKLDWYENHN